MYSVTQVLRLFFIVFLGNSGPKFNPWVGKIPEEGMATHSNILAWRIPWTEEPGGLQGHTESDTTEVT